MRRILGMTATVAVMAMVAAGVATAGREQETIICGGQPLTVTVTTVTNDHGVAYGVGTISGGTHLIPTSFSFTATDLTTNSVVFSDTQAKGNGNGQHNQPTITCTQVEQTTAGELGIPGIAPDHLIQLDLVVTAVQKP